MINFSVYGRPQYTFVIPDNNFPCCILCTGADLVVCLEIMVHSAVLYIDRTTTVQYRSSAVCFSESVQWAVHAMAQTAQATVVSHSWLP